MIDAFSRTDGSTLQLVRSVRASQTISVARYANVCAIRDSKEWC